MPLDPTIALAYWEATTVDQPLPELDEDDPVAALLALLEGATPDTPAFRREPQEVEDPYPGIAVSEGAGELEAWAVEITGLVPLTMPSLEDCVLYIDGLADADGNHRAYVFMGGVPEDDIASIDDALRWMTAAVKCARGELPESAVHEVKASLPEPSDWAWSGADVYCHMRDLPLDIAYDAWSNRLWLRFEEQTISNIAPDEPAAARLGMIVEVENVLRSRKLTRRHASLSLEEPHRRLVAMLKDLTAAVIGQRPPQVVVDTAESDDPELAESARAWLARFEVAGTARPAASPAHARLLRALGAVLDSLVSDGAVELAEGARELLAEELTLAALDAANPRHVLKKLRATMLHSHHVDEIFVGDLELESAFRTGLGGD